MNRRPPTPDDADGPRRSSSSPTEPPHGPEPPRLPSPAALAPLALDDLGLGAPMPLPLLSERREQEQKQSQQQQQQLQGGWPQQPPPKVELTPASPPASGDPPLPSALSHWPSPSSPRATAADIISRKAHEDDAQVVERVQSGTRTPPRVSPPEFSSSSPSVRRAAASAATATAHNDQLRSRNETHDEQPLALSAAQSGRPATATDEAIDEAEGENDRSGWVQQMEASDYRSPTADDGRGEHDDEPPFEQIALSSPPPAAAPEPPLAAAAPTGKAKRQKAAGVGFSSTVRVLRQADSDGSLHVAAGGGREADGFASIGEGNQLQTEGGSGAAPLAGRRRLGEREQTAQLWQAGPSPTSTDFPPDGASGLPYHRSDGRQTASSVRSTDSAGFPTDNAHPYGYPRGASEQETYGGPSYLSNGYDSDASSNDDLDSKPRPFYARSESEASSTFSLDEMGDDEDVLYDWSGEEDLVDQEAKVQEKLGLRQKRVKRWGPVRAFKSLFSTVIGSTFLSACLIAVPLCVHYLWERENPTEHRQYVSDNIGAWFYFFAFNVLVSWYLAVLLDLLPLAVIALVRAVWGSVTEKMKIHVETYGVVKGWIKPIFYAASIWGSWAVIFQQIYNLHSTTDDVPSRAPYTRRLYQVIEFLFFFMLIYCICKILLQFIALSFHRVAFKDRLTEIEFNVAVLDRLNLYRPKTSRRSAGYSSSGYATPKSLFTSSRKVSPADGGANGGGSAGGEKRNPQGFIVKSRTNGGRSTPASSSSAALTGAAAAERDAAADDGLSAGEYAGSHSYPPRLTDPDEEEKTAGTSSSFGRFAGHVGKGVRKVALHDARNIKGKQGQTENGDLVNTLTSAKVAKNLARTIYKSYRSKKRAYLVPEDFYVAFETVAAAQAAFSIFDKDGNGDISKSEIKSTIMKTYKERRFLAKALQDVDQAVGSLNNVLLFFGAVILFFVALAIFGVKIGTQITSLYTLLIGLSFIFKSAAGNAFDSIIFLFVTHPFDTGDRVFIGTENLVVKKMGIWSTSFVRVDGTDAYYYNSILFGSFITNVRRSGGMFENMTVQVGWDTTNEQIDQLEKRINNWLSQDDKRDLASSTAIMYQTIDFQRSMTLTIGIPHLQTWQDWGARQNRRTRFHAAVKFYMEQLDITFKNSPQPIRFVTPDGRDAFPQQDGPPPSAVVDEPSPLAGTPARKVSMSMFRRPSMGIPHPAKASAGAGAEESLNDGGATEEPMRPALGFLPTPKERGAGAEMQMRRRRARSKKQMTIAG